MKPGITFKLFVAMLACAILAAAAMGLGAHLSFQRGFIGYLNEQGLERVDELVPLALREYQTHGDWEHMRERPRAWWSLLRPPRPQQQGEERGQRERKGDGAGPGKEVRTPHAPPESELTGVSLRMALLDASYRHVAGNPKVGRDALLRPIVSDGVVVGWLGLLPFQQVSSAAGVEFQENLLKTNGLILLLAVALAALMAMFLARRLLAPVRAIARGTRRLAQGDYSERIEVDSQDEIGRLASDFNHLAHALENTERQRRDFMADVSHELRTPLAVLRGELEAMEDGVRPLTPAGISSLQAEVKSLGKLVSDLYDLSLSDVGALTYRMRRIDLRDVLGQSLQGFQERLSSHALALDCVLPDEPLPIDGDEGRLRQLFGNLLENTVRYTDAGGCLRIRARIAGASLEVDFMDSAPGIPDELLPRLFERFYRVEASRNRASGGAGLGLALCQRIMTAHDGSITAAPSELGGLKLTLGFRLAAAGGQA